MTFCGAIPFPDLSGVICRDLELLYKAVRKREKIQSDRMGCCFCRMRLHFFNPAKHQWDSIVCCLLRFICLFIYFLFFLLSSVATSILLKKVVACLSNGIKRPSQLCLTHLHCILYCTSPRSNSILLECKHHICHPFQHSCIINL